MIDVKREKLLTVSQAADQVSRTPQRVYDWIKRGLGGIHLEVVRLGHLRTSEEAIQRFAERTAPQQESLPRSKAERARASRRAAKLLELNGA